MEDKTLNTEAAAPSPAPYPTGPMPTLVQQEGKPAKQEAKIPDGTEKVDKVAATVEEPPIVAETEDKSKAKPEIKEEKKDKTKEDDDRFDKHPRFQELNRRANKAEKIAAEALQRLSAMEQRLAELSKKPDIPVEQELRELYDEDPAKALARAVEIGRDQAVQQFSSESADKANYTQLAGALKDFEKSNPDFTELWDTGALTEAGEQNPLLNTPIAAYLAITGEQKIQALKDAHKAELEAEIAKARKEEQDKAKKEIETLKANIKAKKDIVVIEDKPSISSREVDAELKNSGGNPNQVLAKRLQRLRERQGAI